MTKPKMPATTDGARADRLAQALRENLARRKAQGRKRAAAGGGAGVSHAPSPQASARRGEGEKAAPLAHEEK